jgi:hypothetical protein
MGTTAPARRGISQICIEYLTAETESARSTAFHALVRYCRKAVGHLYPPSEYETVASIKTDPRVRDGLPTFFADDASTRTTEFIHEWLLEFLLPYCNATFQELTEEAERDTFRYIGRKCRLALIKRIQKAQRKHGKTRVRRLLDNTFETDDGAAEPLVNFVVRPDAIDPIVWIEENRKALQERGIYEVCCSMAAQYLDGDRVATEKLAQSWGVSVRQAQNRRREIIGRIRGELRCDPVVRELFTVISDYRERRRPAGLFISPSPEAAANAKLLEEAASDGRDFYIWCQAPVQPNEPEVDGDSHKK